jgi:hypothetical protein
MLGLMSCLAIRQADHLDLVSTGTPEGGRSSRFAVGIVGMGPNHQNTQWGSLAAVTSAYREEGSLCGKRYFSTPPLPKEVVAVANADLPQDACELIGHAESQRNMGHEHHATLCRRDGVYRDSVVGVVSALALGR